MQKSIIAIALALTLTCAFASYTPNNYIKAPVTVIQDSETNYTSGNLTGSPLILASVTVGNLFLVAQNYSPSTVNTSANSFAVFYRQLDSKALTTTGSNLTANFTATPTVKYINNYVVSFAVENDTGIPQVRAYQVPLTGGAALPRLTLSSNTFANVSVTPVGYGYISKTIYVFTLYSNKNRVNVTSFTVGGSALGSLEWIFSESFNSSLSLAWGESLSSSQLFATWIDNSVLKDSIVDLSKGAVTPNTVNGWNANYVCSAFATDKKWYGDLCYAADTPSATTTYYVRSANTTLIQLANYTTNTSAPNGAYQYGPYLALFYSDSISTPGSATLIYEIWNLDTFTTFKNRTTYLTIDTKSTVVPFRVVSGGLYTLLYNNAQQAPNTTTLTSVQVGLLLGSSYLTTIFGSLLAIIAGLLLV
jgi:hypothetical protein